MKNIWKILIGFVVIIVVIIAGILLYPKIYIKHTIDNLKLSFWCPTEYKQTDDGEIKCFINNKNNITIEIYIFNKAFFGEKTIEEKLKSYEELLVAHNYGIGLVQNTSTEIVDISNVLCGKISTQVKTVNKLNKEITLILPQENCDVIFSIHSVDENINNNINEIEKIIKSVKIK